MTTNDYLHPEEAQKLMDRYGEGCTIRSDATLDWGFIRHLLYIGYDGDELVILHGEQTVACFAPYPPTRWRHGGYVSIYNTKHLVPLRDYLTTLIDAELAGLPVTREGERP